MRLLLTLVLALTLSSCHSSSHKSSNSSQPWQFAWSTGVPASPTPTATGFYFDFPTDPTQSVNYLQWFRAPNLVGATAISIKYEVTGSTFVAIEYPENPALVSLLLQRKNDNWRMPAYRWYSNDAVKLAPGEFELTVELTPTAFGDVYGGHDPGEFQTTLRDLSNIGIVFGSAGGRGHGVYATEPSRFTLTSITVIH